MFEDYKFVFTKKIFHHPTKMSLLMLFTADGFFYNVIFPEL